MSTSGGPEGTPSSGWKGSSVGRPPNRIDLLSGISGVSFERAIATSVVSELDGVRVSFIGHDPHDAVIHPANPRRWYQQNHCGIYRLDWQDDGKQQRWKRIGNNMPKDVGDIGFPMTCHPRDDKTVWVVPMDGGTVWPRASVGGRPAVFRSRDGCESWQRLDRGLPRQAWHTVLRQAMAHNGGTPLELVFGTTSGEVWGSRDEGDSWQTLTTGLPKIMSITAARLD